MISTSLNDSRIKTFSKYNYIPKGILTEEEKREYIKCKTDRDYFLTNYFYIKHPAYGTSIPMPIRPKQKLANNILDRYHFLIILKSRQTGMSTDLAGYVLWSMLFFDNWGAGVISKRSKEAKKFIAKIKFAIKHLSERHAFLLHRVEKANESEILFNNNSSVISDTATEDGVRGDTMCFLVVDEVAFNKKMSEAYQASYHTLGLIFASYMKAEKEGRTINRPWGVAMLSSPNGKKGKGQFFYKLWKNAKHPYSKNKTKNLFVPLKYHWSEISEYTGEWYKSECAALDYNILRIKQELDLIFLDSTSEILPEDLVRDIVVMPKPKYQFYGRKLNVYKKPEQGKEYIIGGDVATGATINNNPDKSALVVIDAHSGLVCADYDNIVQYPDFANVAFNVSKLYNFGVLAVERNSIGLAVLQLLQATLRYPNLYRHRGSLDHKTKKPVIGFPTTTANRNRIVSKAIAYLYENPILNSLALLSEFTELENKNGKIAAYGGSHDDLVMAFAIALEVRTSVYGYEIGVSSLVNPISDEEAEELVDRNMEVLLASNDINLDKTEKESIGNFHKEITRIENSTGMYFSNDEIDSVMKKFGNIMNKKKFR